MSSFEKGLTTPLCSDCAHSEQRLEGTGDAPSEQRAEHGEAWLPPKKLPSPKVKSLRRDQHVATPGSLEHDEVRFRAGWEDRFEGSRRVRQSWFDSRTDCERSPVSAPPAGRQQAGSRPKSVNKGGPASGRKVWNSTFHYKNPFSFTKRDKKDFSLIDAFRLLISTQCMYAVRLCVTCELCLLCACMRCDFAIQCV